MSLYTYCEVCNRSVEFGHEDRHDCEQGTKQNRSQHEQLETEVVSLKQRNEALQTELDEQCKLNGMGAEREYILLGKIERMERVVEAAREVYEHNCDALIPGCRLDICVMALGEALEALGSQSASEPSERCKDL